ncbi:carboxymuconolactone decarboxylase family protein [Microbaculum marinisediminis]|uniref:Carboxymuconolactone decarboxylase-like domain-containing protein n=1 Tax=Microbaculum marinisediminis TaxID=2931392 RepID=A0AAW5QUT4_9HYPH|nr:hypothetical protein [Microbaculum sp. A6E488]MCT8971841.1 hypothetical protein [Microbaculum sp. A6E488]
MDGLSLDALRKMVQDRLASVSDGQPLSDLDAALVRFALACSPFALHPQLSRSTAQDALRAGATPAQLHTVVVLVSGVGVHALMEGSRLVDALCHGPEADAPLSRDQQEIWDRHVGDRRIWKQLDAQVPGFLKSLLRQSPRAFESFFPSMAVAWQEEALTPVQIEMICIALDAMQAQRYGPGLRLHLDAAVGLGAGRRQLLQVLDIAAAPLPHPGIP